jgi:hypothetical protein
MPGPMTLSPRAVLAAASLAAVAGCSTYSVRKSALAPHIAPPMRSGQALGDASSEASFAASTLTSADRPREGEDANAGLHIPRYEVGAALRGRLSQNLDVGLLWDHGFREGARPTSPDQPTPDNGAVFGGGAGMFASLPTAMPGLRIGVGLDLMVYSIPYVEYRTCVPKDCFGRPHTMVDEDRDLIGVYSASLIPSWRVSSLTLFAGGTLRNHPTIVKASTESDFDDDEEVENGPANLLVSAGAEIDIGAGVRLLGMIYQPVTTDPVEYAPTLAVALTIPLARRVPRRASVPASRPAPTARR